MSNILQKIADWHKKKLPFVVYKKPNSNIFSAFFQQTDELFYTENYTETGFVFAPFDDNNPSVLIPKNQSEFLQELIDCDEVVNNELQTVINKKEEEFHVKIVDKAIKNIVDNQFRKVVLSRKELVKLDSFNLVETFKRLITNYSAAMVYVWFHPKVGLWLGATPETLVKINGNNFETMSLAGTQLYNGTTEVTWQEKEIDEQQVVTDYIVDTLETICTKVSAEKVQTVKAGSLLHLKTKITGSLKNSNFELITVLHPTPAVCGFPKAKAKEFILKNENYNREFYTGFLGELNVVENGESITSLYVNLRCMQVKDTNVFIYVGGGITRDSISRKEWKETVDKTKIMKSIL